MPFKQMPPDLTDFNNWFAKQDVEIVIGLDDIRVPEEMIKPIAKAAWDEACRLHAEYLSGELARIDAERQSE